LKATKVAEGVAVEENELSSIHQRNPKKRRCQQPSLSDQHLTNDVDDDNVDWDSDIGNDETADSTFQLTASAKVIFWRKCQRHIDILSVVATLHFP
jgi:hypothetical protein